MFRFCGACRRRTSLSADSPSAEPRCPMPHLTADALRDDPEGLAFLRGVLKPGGREPAGAAPGTKPEIAESVRLPRPAGPARPPKPAVAAR